MVWENVADRISIVTNLNGGDLCVGQDHMLSVIVGEFGRVGMARHDVPPPGTAVAGRAP
jgi:hypothetical protein